MKSDWRVYFSSGILALLIAGYAGDEIFNPHSMVFSFRVFSLYIIAAIYFLAAIAIAQPPRR